MISSMTGFARREVSGAFGQLTCELRSVNHRYLEPGFRLPEELRARGFAEADYEFFRIHVECDDGHAETIRDIMAALARKDPEQLDIMIAAGQSLVDARWRFFDDCMAYVVEEEVA